MAEYIEREAVIAEFKRLTLGENSLIERVFADGVYAVLETFPASEVSKIVRCGECKHWKINPNNLYGGQCRFSECASIDHFCSRGERKERKGGAKNV